MTQALAAKSERTRAERCTELRFVAEYSKVVPISTVRASYLRHRHEEPAGLNSHQRMIERETNTHFSTSGRIDWPARTCGSALAYEPSGCSRDRPDRKYVRHQLVSRGFPWRWTNEHASSGNAHHGNQPIRPTDR
jgi:hypothetical protein